MVPQHGHGKVFRHRLGGEWMAQRVRRRTAQQVPLPLAAQQRVVLGLAGSAAVMTWYRPPRKSHSQSAGGPCLEGTDA